MRSIQRKGFTLIELLVVIAIIGILATLVVTQLGSARVKARNASAKNDVGQMKTAVEVYKTDNADNVVGSATAATLNGTTGATFLGFFTGTTGASSYITKIEKTPSSEYTYSYQTSAVTGTPSVARGYSLGSNLVATGSGTETYFSVLNGQTNSSTSATTPPAPVVPTY